jgi:hypothetical protein
MIMYEVNYQPALLNMCQFRVNSGETKSGVYFTVDVLWLCRITGWSQIATAWIVCVL